MTNTKWYLKELSPKGFLLLVLMGGIGCLACAVGINVAIDIYGLFRPINGRELQVDHNERVSKYLLAYKYVPQKFNTVVLGTSLSDNVDFTKYNDSIGQFKIYNASIMGANISELKPIAEKLVENGLKYAIICFSPYMTKNSGSKEVEFGPKLYYGALGSKNLYETYMLGLIRNLELLPNKFPKNQINSAGVNDYELNFKVSNIKEKIQFVIEGTKDENLRMDSVARIELQEFILLLKKNNVKYVGYFHPVPYEILESKKEDYANFEQEVRKYVGNDGVLIDFNSEEFKYITTNYGNYIDHGHLSKTGQKLVAKVLYSELEKQK